MVTESPVELSLQFQKVFENIHILKAEEDRNANGC